MCSSSLRMKTMQTNTTFLRWEEASRGLYNKITYISVISTLLVVTAFVGKTFILILNLACCSLQYIV